MKTFFLTVGLTFLAMSFVIQENSLDQIVNAFKKADTEEISQSFDDFLDMKILGGDEVKNVGKKQASIVVKNFFAHYAITGFEKLAARELQSTTYLVGKLQTADKNSKGYNITILIKERAGKFQIVSLRIS